MRSLVLLLSTVFIMHQAQAETPNTVNVTDVYAYATAENQKNGAVFFTLEHQAPNDRLIAAKADDIAQIVELHTHIMEGEVMKMRKTEAFDIPQDGKLELKPHADHIMLMGLKAPLTEGQTFPLTLSFEKAGERVIEVPVVKAGFKPAAAESHEGHTEKNHEHHSHH